MARVKLLDSNGKPKLTKDGREEFIYSVDGRREVAAGRLAEVWEKQQIGDKKKNVLIAYRPVTDEDKKKKAADLKKKIAEMEAEAAKLDGNAEKPATVNEESAEETPETDAQSSEDEKAEESTEAPKRTRKTPANGSKRSGTRTRKTKPAADTE